MKLVLDQDGHALLEKRADGKILPVYEYEDGTKKEFDAGATLEGLNKKLNALEEEKTRHFNKAEEYKAKVESFKGIDPDAAKDALRIVENLSDKKLLDEKGVEAVKEEVRKTMKSLAEERENALKETHMKDREEWGSKFSTQQQLIRNLVVDNLFANSDYFSGEEQKTIYPPDDASKIFGGHVDVKIEDGMINVTMIGKDRKPIMSKINHGEPADFNEGMGLILDQHPRKHEILKTGKSGGPGSSGNLKNEGKDPNKMTSVELIAHGLKRHAASSHSK